jgi:hypothetical protein
MAGIKGDCLAHLSGFPTWSRLLSLSLGSNEMADSTLLALTGGLTRIESLGLTYNWIGPSGLAGLLSSSNLASLKGLAVGGNPIRAAGATAIASCAALGELTHLEIHTCEIGAAGMLALATSPWLNKLAFLDVRGNRSTREARAALRARFPGTGA